MSRSAIVWIVGILVIAGGVGGYLVTRDDDNSSQSTSQSNGQASGDNNFAPISTKGLPFVATITTSAQNGSSEAKLEYDGKEKTRYSATMDSQTIEIIYTSDTYYFCSAGCKSKFDADPHKYLGAHSH